MITNDSSPLLSICIPTLNRAHLLDDALVSLRPEVASCADRVEVVVSDNGSSDATGEVLQRHGDWVHWGRNERTTGFADNLLRVTCDLAKGRFVWVIGDDDLVIRGSVGRILHSLETNPDLDYHYLNFGWLDVRSRTRIIREMDSVPPSGPRTRWQCDELRTLRLERIEDLAFLPSNNASALFSGIFCFAARRELFIEGRRNLHPSDSLDGSSTLISDHFPHAMITLPPLAGKPVAYLGQPCLLQGISNWEWGKYAYKNMLFGTHQLFSWLEGSTFAKDAMEALWSSFYTMAGRLFFRMLYYPEDHNGTELVRESVMPSAALRPEYWKTFLEEARLAMECDLEAKVLVELTEQLLDGHPQARLGLWGIQGRGHRFVKFSSLAQERLAWAADREEHLHGVLLEGTDLHISPPQSLPEAELGILVLGTRRDIVGQVMKEARPILRKGTLVVSVKGIEEIW